MEDLANHKPHTDEAVVAVVVLNGIVDAVAVIVVDWMGGKSNVSESTLGSDPFGWCRPLCRKNNRYTCEQ